MQVHKWCTSERTHNAPATAGASAWTEVFSLCAWVFWFSRLLDGLRISTEDKAVPQEIRKCHPLRPYPSLSDSGKFAESCGEPRRVETLLILCDGGKIPPLQAPDDGTYGQNAIPVLIHCSRMWYIKALHCPGNIGECLPI